MEQLSLRLAATLRNNKDELDRRLSKRQRFPFVGDGSKTREIAAEIIAAEVELDRLGEFDPKAVARRRLRQWRALLEARYAEWREANAP